MGSHGAVASYALGEEVWEAVRLDWRTAPVQERLRVTLGFLEKLTLRPSELTRGDAVAVLSTGVTEEALVDAIHVAALFNMIVRLADSLGWDVPSDDAFSGRAQAMLESGYALSRVEA
jgi:alkylhydroperoxidase family enzyme